MVGTLWRPVMVEQRPDGSPIFMRSMARNTLAPLQVGRRLKPRPIRRTYRHLGEAGDDENASQSLRGPPSDATARQPPQRAGEDCAAPGDDKAHDTIFPHPSSANARQNRVISPHDALVGTVGGGFGDDQPDRRVGGRVTTSVSPWIAPLSQAPRKAMRASTGARSRSGSSRCSSQTGRRTPRWHVWAEESPRTLSADPELP